MIDSHQHFWRYNAAEYDWIDDSMALLRRDFLPPELAEMAAVAGVAKTVAVQARQTVEETEWLLQLADETDLIAGVVGWVPLTQPGVNEVLGRLSANPRLRGVRHVVQAEPDPEFMLQADFERGIRSLQEFDLTYDILTHAGQLEQAIRFVDRHPNQRFVLDHLSKPHIQASRARDLEHYAQWSQQIFELSRRANVSCKVSGMVTEADWTNWKPEDLKPYLDVVLEAFTPARMMAGSDWPVCTVAVEYRQWWKMLREFFIDLSVDEQAEFFSGTAIKTYVLKHLQQ